MRDPSLRAIQALREALAAGRFEPGGPIPIADEAVRLGISPTPVREALARLAGAGLVADAPGGGYAAPDLQPSDIASYYKLHHAYLRQALDDFVIAERASEVPTREGARVAPEAETVFDRLIVRAADRTLWAAYNQLRDQLEGLRLVEPVVLGELTSEAQGLRRLEAMGDVPALRGAVAAYHRRRMLAAAALWNAWRIRIDF